MRRRRWSDEGQAWQDLRRALWKRCRRRCERCGRRLAVMSAMDGHHRKQRSLGGRDTLTNLVGLCRRCHDRVHSAGAEAKATGYLVPSWGHPAEVPVLMHDGTYWLTMDGDLRKDGSAYLVDRAPGPVPGQPMGVGPLVGPPPYGAGDDTEAGGDGVDRLPRGP